MLATKMIRARFLASTWRPFGRRSLRLVLGSGESFVVTAKVRHCPNPGDEVLIIDVADDRPILAMNRRPRLYVNFEKKGLVPEGGYAVWVSDSVTAKQASSPDYECMSVMVREWFTTADDEVALTLLAVEHGGTLRMTNDLLTRL